MISVNEATSLIADRVPSAKKIKLPISKLEGKILAQDILSERDQPPFHRMAMDGIAIDFKEFQKGRRDFVVQGIQSAGEPQKTLEKSGDCIEGMTGGVLPKNATAVIRYEDIDIDHHGTAHVKENLTFNMFNNIHEKGSDHKAGDVVLKAGTLLRGPQIGIIAANGYAEVDVVDTPKIAVISTGDELVDLGQEPLDYQIRRSNPYAIRSELNCLGFNQVNMFHLLDDEKHLFDELATILADHDILVLSGGVSAGKFDYLPKVFGDLQVEEVFHKVAQRPGKPLWFGTKENKMVFGLPGNPVSAITCLRRFVVPALQKMQKGFTQTTFATLTEDYTFNKNLTYFCPVKVEVSSEGTMLATPIKTNGSGDYGSLAYSDGFVEMDIATDLFKAGTAHKIFLWGQF